MAALSSSSSGSLLAERRRVGSSDLFVPALALGCSPLGELWDDVPPVQALQAIEAAYELGFRHFDTAPWYGNGSAEARVGMALGAIARRSSEGFTVSTKVGRSLDPEPRGTAGPWEGPWKGGCDLKVRCDYGYDAILQQHRESCLRMGLPRVDALAIHDLDAMFGGQAAVEKYLEQLRGPKGGLRALAELKATGAIRAVGIGCNPYKFGSREVCQAVVDMGGIDYILLAGPYNLLNQEALDDLLPLCRDRNVSVFLGAPFASGILAVGAKGARSGGARPNYMYEAASDEMLDKVAKIEAVCERHSVSLPAAALRFPLFHPRVACVLSGVKSEAEVRRAADFAVEVIPPAFWRELRSEGLLRSDAPIAGDDVSHL
eukprot:TRINITY_DN73168_c0_g1_i1.p1 TRINITY_DN73168_c0_g1~~TRINITY_DN73168_c0_g1_i1.p1  ORF type:complete len:400 (-),score=88.40 TRINITY_DN73168_c0_g1_i1:114-1235(-)